MPDDEARFQWLLDVRAADIGAASAEDLARLYREAWFVVLDGEGDWFADDQLELSGDLDLERQQWKIAQRSLEATLAEAILENRFPEMLEPWLPDKDSPLELTHALTWMPVTSYRGLSLACRNLLRRLGRHRLKTCPLLLEGNPCGRLFLARRRQQYCTIQHTRQACQRRFRAKHGPRKV